MKRRCHHHLFVTQRYVFLQLTTLLLFQETNEYLHILYIAECVQLVIKGKKRLPLALEFLKLRPDGTPETSKESVSTPMTVLSVENAEIVASFFNQKLQHVQWEIEENNTLFYNLTNENILLQNPVDLETGIVDMTRKKRKRL